MSLGKEGSRVCHVMTGFLNSTVGSKSGCLAVTLQVIAWPAKPWILCPYPVTGCPSGLQLLSSARGETNYKSEGSLVTHVYTCLQRKRPIVKIIFGETKVLVEQTVHSFVMTSKSTL